MKVVVKLGGSLITDKAKPFTAREDIIRMAARAAGKSIENGSQILIVHGGGSFGHVVAKSEIELYGELRGSSVPPVSEAMMELNNKVMKYLLEAGAMAVSFPPHSFCLNSCSKGTYSCYFEPLLRAFSLGLTPVTFGDILIGEDGCRPSIISGDDLSLILAEKVGAERVVFATNVEGIYRDLSDPLSLITQLRLHEIPKILSEIRLSQTSVADVTSGLPGKLMKIYRYLSSSMNKPEVAIIDGSRSEVLKKALSGGEIEGTLILP